MATITDASGQRSRELLDDERLDDVSDLHVLIARDADAALEALLHLGRVVLEAAKRADLAFVNDAAVANEAYGSRTRDDAVRDHAAPDRPDLRNLERLANLGVPAGDFLLDGVEEARHGFLDLVRERVDDGVETDVDAFVVGGLLGLLLGLHVEPDDDGVGRRGEEDVVHRDRADSGVQDADLHLLGGELAERLDENLLGAVHVGFHDEGEILHLAFLHPVEERVERHARGLRERFLALLERAELRDLARLAFVLDDLERIARVRDVLEAHDLDRRCRRRLGDARGVVVEHRAHAAYGRAGEEDVADVKRALLHEHRRERALAGLAARLEHDAPGGPRRHGLQLEEIGLEQDHLEELVDSDFLLRGDLAGHDVAAEFLDEDSLLGELLLDALRVRLWLVDLVDGHDDRYLGGARVVDRFLRLRHDAVVGRDHQDDDVRGLGAARAHQGERLVPRRIEEDDGLAFRDDAMGDDVLRNAAGLALGDVLLADRIELRGLAVVDVTHAGHDRRARDPLPGAGGRTCLRRGRGRRLVRSLLARELELFLERHDRRLDAELAGDLHGDLRVERLVDRREHAARQERLHEVLFQHPELLGKLLDGDAFREEDGALGLLLDLDDLAGLRGHRLLAGAALRGLGKRLGRERLVRPFGRRRRDVLVGVLLVRAEVLAHVLFERRDRLRARFLRRGFLRVVLLDAKARLRGVLLSALGRIGQHGGGHAERRAAEGWTRSEPGARGAAGARGEA